MKTHILTHNDVDGLKSAAHILRLDSYANIHFFEKNRLTVKELREISKCINDEDFVFLIERDPETSALNELYKLNKRVKGMFFFGHYVTNISKNDYDKLIKNIYCLFSGDFNQPTETVVRPFVKALLGEIAPTFKNLEKKVTNKRSKIEELKKEYNSKNGWIDPKTIKLI